MKMRSNLGAVRWLVIPVIAFDTFMTLLGQPASYWQAPATANEGNPFFEWFLVRGQTFFLVTSAGYIAGAFLLTTFLPRRLALVVLLAFLFGHYLGASSWMLWRFELGMSAPVLYGSALAAALVWLGLDVRGGADRAALAAPQRRGGFGSRERERLTRRGRRVPRE